MSAPPITPHQLRLEVARARRKDPEALVIGLRAPGPWAGDDGLDLGDRHYDVVVADTVLAVRQALDAAEGRGRPTVVLTPLDQAELGQDVVARLARSRLAPVDPWEAVKGLFEARRLDPSVRERCLARALLEHVPPEGKYPPVPAGVLDAATAWRAVLHHGLGLEDREPDLPGLLRWAAATGADRYLAAPADLRAATRARLAAMLGPAAGSILDLVESGAARDALAVALACEVVFAAGVEDPALPAAAARLERFHRHRPIAPEVGRALARAAAVALEDLAEDRAHQDQPHLSRADAILREIRADELAHLGHRTPLAWEGRLRRFARALDEAIRSRDGAGLDDGAEAARRVGEHALAGQPAHRPRYERVRMALRLARWLRTPPDPAGSFGTLARRYRDEVALVDWARDALAGGDELPELSDAYGRLERAVAARRAEFNRAFGVALANWTACGSDPGEVLPVEDALARVVAPILEAKQPVLLVVLDGLSWAVAHELLADLRRRHWAEALAPGQPEPPPPVVAAIPSVTELSRTSLLAGCLHRGKQDDERRLFPAHAALLARCERGYPPRLFHKGQLTEGGRGALAREVEEAVLEPRSRLVAAVINAVDDRLAGAAQLRDVWSAESIRPLGTLLRLAREVGRTVVLASDHGHVWQRGGAARPAADAAARWRPADGLAGEGEVLLEGERVRGPGEARRVIAPWAEDVRYGAIRTGYHGGATPQEMVAPLVLLADLTARRPAPEPAERRPPTWWEEVGAAAPAVGAPHPAATPRAPVGYLFPTEPPQEPAPSPAPTPEAPSRRPSAAPDAPAWLDRLLASDAYRAQRQLVRRFAPEDETVRAVLAALDAHGGALTPIALAHRVGVPAARLDGLVAKLRRLLNLEGYEVLRLDRPRDVVELDVVLLRRQFELG